MPVTRPAGSTPARDREPVRAVDIAGKVWSRSNPARLYRFIESRNELLKTIVAGRR